MRLASKANLVWFALYLAAMAIIVWQLVRIRDRQLAGSHDPQAQADWDAWRTAAAAQAGSGGTVERRGPKTAEPPLRVLMRDHFGSMIFGGLLAGTALFGLLMFLVHAMTHRPKAGPAAKRRIE